MKKVLFALGLLLLGGLVQAQTVPAQLSINWVNPTTTTDGLALTGNLALVENQFVISTSPIPANYSGAPTFTVTPTPLTTTYELAVPNNSTLYVRMRACNRPTTALDCSTWTVELTKLVSVVTTPGMPTNLIINLTIGSGGG